MGVTVNDDDIDKLVEIIANTSKDFNTSRPIDFNSSSSTSFVFNSSASNVFNPISSTNVFNDLFHVQPHLISVNKSGNYIPSDDETAPQLPLAQDNTLLQISARPIPDIPNLAAVPPVDQVEEVDTVKKGELFGDSFSSSVSDVEDFKELVRDPIQ